MGEAGRGRGEWHVRLTLTRNWCSGSIFCFFAPALSAMACAARYRAFSAVGPGDRVRAPREISRGL